MQLEPGVSAAVETEVTTADTALALGSGSVEVLGTPRVVALCEHATVSSIDGRLEPGTTTVGMRVNLDHIRPSPVGTRLSARATLEKIEGRRLTFRVVVEDAAGVVAEGRVVRVVVDLARFLAKADAGS